MSKLDPECTVEAMNNQQVGHLPHYLGVELVEIAQGLCKSKMVVQPHHLAPNGYMHAASVIALADTTCGFATHAHRPEGALTFTTIELKSNFLGTATKGTIYCEATPQHMGRNTHVWDAVVWDDDGKKIALFRCTQMILWPKEG